VARELLVPLHREFTLGLVELVELNGLEPTTS
jgi:hypothetical protein